MPTPSFDSLGVLRHTCDRCRKLKVRCQRATESADFAGETDVPIACVRCSRAGAICAYSRKKIHMTVLQAVYRSGTDLNLAPQRSGRPPVPRYGGHSWSISKPASSKGHQSQIVHRTLSTLSPIASSSRLGSCNPSTSPLLPQGSKQNFQSAGSWDDPDNCGSFAEDIQSLLDIDQCMRTVSPTVDVGGNLEALEEPIASDQQQARFFHAQDQEDELFRTVTNVSYPSSDEHSCEPDNTVKDIMDLSNLNLSIHKMAAKVSLQIPCDEITDVTRCLLRVMSRVIRCAQQRVENEATSFPLSPFSPLTIEGRRHRSAHHPAHTCENAGMLGAADMATVMMILSCYQRLFDLLTQACLVLQAQVTRSDHSEGYAEKFGASTSNPSEGSVSSSCGDEAKPFYSIAQVAMITELICHLLNQLERGLRKLFPPRRADSGITSPSSPSIPIGPTALVSSLGTASIPTAMQEHCHEWSTGSSDASITTTSTSSSQIDSGLGGSIFVIRTLLRAQKSLHTHIQMVKESVRASHDV